MWLWPLTLWPWPRVNSNVSPISIICISIIKIHSSAHFYSRNKKKCINTYVILTFDRVTLTLGQLYRLININNICEYHQDPSIRPWFIAETRILHKHINVTLTFDLVTLTLGQLYRLININNICKYHQDQSIRSLFIGEKHSMRRDTRTDTGTHGHTDGRTDITAYRVASTFVGATNKMPQ